MHKELTWDEIKTNYPKEWVAVRDYHRTGAIGVSGKLITHHPDCRKFHEEVRAMKPQPEK